MRNEEKKINERPEAYPKPTKTDKQLQNQPEYIDEQPNDFHDKSISNIPGNKAERSSNDPGKDMRNSE